MKTPYDDALEFITLNPGTAGALGLAKLVLSLYNDDCAFSFRECITSLDDNNTALAVRVAEHFAGHGEDAELRRAGERLLELNPRLWDLGQAATNAKEALRRRWNEDQCRAEMNG
jgi:hypothetical protein